MKTIHQYPLGFDSVIKVLDLGRGAFFNTKETDLPLDRKSPVVADDDLMPQFGYVGAKYRNTRVLLLGINPGNGPNGGRNKGDQVAMPVLGKFVRDRTAASFLEAQRVFQKTCESWHIWRRYCSEVIGAGRLTMNEISYSNCLPWRTASQSKFGDDCSLKAAKFYAYPLIDELQPRIIIAMGKKAARILAIGGRHFPDGGRHSPELIVWNRSQAATVAVRQERTATALSIGRILGRDTEWGQPQRSR